MSRRKPCRNCGAGCYGTYCRACSLCVSRERNRAELIARSDKTGYHTAHTRCKRLWGGASSYPCAGCGTPAASDWAYDGADPEEKIITNGRYAGRRYSPWPEFYIPLCSKCHRPRDRSLAKKELTIFRLYLQATSKTLEDIEREINEARRAKE